MRHREGVVVQSRGGVYSVALDDGPTVEASLRKRLKRQARTGDRVVIGDRVEVAGDEAAGFTVEAVHPRRNEITRQGAGGRRPRVVAANVDRLLAVVAGADPEPQRLTVDRILVIGEANDVDPVLVVNKVDLPGAREVADGLADSYGAAGYPVHAVSAVSGEGLEALEALLCSGTSALMGPSGVGKSSLLNAVEPGLDLRVGELSSRRRSGRHTTVSSRLIELTCGGRVADTPGFSDVGVWGLDPSELDLCFPEMVELRDECRFRACSHLHEPGCAVREAAEEGGLDPVRYESYRVLASEGR